MSGFVEIEQATVSSEEFLKVLKRFKEFRIKFKTDDPEPFKYIYPVISKRELRWIVRSNRSIVTYEIRYNSKVGKEYNGIVYVHKMKMTILDNLKQ